MNLLDMGLKIYVTYELFATNVAKMKRTTRRTIEE